MTIIDQTTRFLCARHGESENVIRGAAGALPEAGLTARGHDQAVRLRDALATEPIAAVYASPAVRAVQTATPCAQARGIPVIEMPGLAEWHLGNREGATDDATRARTAEVVRSWVVDRDWSAAIADGEDGTAVRDRAMAALAAIADRHRGDLVLVVAHVVSLTAAIAAFCPDLAVWGRPMPHATPFRLTRAGREWRSDGWS